LSFVETRLYTPIRINILPFISLQKLLDGSFRNSRRAAEDAQPARRELAASLDLNLDRAAANAVEKSERSQAVPFDERGAASAAWCSCHFSAYLLV
jgi:hypothetical protein